MSTPKWNENEPRLVITPASVGGPWNVVRGSPKLARTGCGRSNGFTGQPYAGAAAVEPAALAVGVPGAAAIAASDARARSAAAARRPSARRRALRVEVVHVVAMRPPSNWP
jgi:hypothetical protein